jgi:DNA primase
MTTVIRPSPSMLNSRDLKVHADFPAIVSRYTRLRRAGRQYVGLCPFHSERHPSLYVEPVRKIWKCFGCGAGGDLFAFVMRAESCNFRQALETVARFSAGVALASDPRSGSRFGVGEGAKPLRPPKAVARHRQSHRDSRAEIIARLEATNRRLRAVEETNRAASAALATPCEPQRTEAVPFT